MPEQQSAALYARGREASDKFDYFIAAITGGIFTYIAQTYVPRVFDFTPATFEPVALVFLAASFFIGLKRIEATYIATQHNYEALDASETAGKMATAINEGVTHGFDPGTGLEFSGEDLFRQKKHHKLLSKSHEQAFYKTTKAAEKYYRWRNRLLFAGFGALLLSKFLSPYFPLTNAQEPPSQQQKAQSVDSAPKSKQPQPKK